MKKILALLLALVMVLSLVACGQTAAEDPETPDNPSVGGEDAPEDLTDEVDEEDVIRVEPAAILADIWANFPEDMKPMTFGGDYENNVENEPAAHTIADGGEELDNSIGYPADMIDKIEEAAALRHMLNVNSFTSGAYYVTNATDTDAVCEGIYNSLMNRSYMCGAPQWIVVMVVYDNYVVNVFGAEDLVFAFRDAAETSFGNSVRIVYDETMDGAHGDNGIDMGGLGLDIVF